LSEKIVMQSSGVKKHDSESPPTMGLKAGAFADLGSLILTDQRLVYIEKGGAGRSLAWALGGALTASAIEKSVSKAEIDELTKNPGSFAIPLQNITSIRAAKKMGGAYLSVANNVAGLKSNYAFAFGGANDSWVNAVNSLKIGSGTSQNASVSTVSQQVPPPPPPDFTPPTCPTCKQPLSYIEQYQRWYCYKDQKYV
jgi:hypothetical protein